ncbi:GNAT family N-acetyltransferase [bacterium]|nr:GNAT family N-acetyltransferase [bacterium]
MSLRVEQCEIGLNEFLCSAWLSILGAMPQYSFFQTPHWSQILDASLPYSTMSPARFRFSDKSEAVLPLFQSSKRFGFQKWESLPWGAYGGLLSESQISHEHYDAAAQKLLWFRAPIFECCENPLLPGGLRTHPTKSCSNKITHIVTVPDDVDALWAKFQPRNRSAIRRAREEGVVVRYGNDEAAVCALQQLYQRAQDEYWSGVETVPQLFFDALLQFPDEHIQVWLAEYKDNVIAADLILYGKNEAQYFIGAANRDYAKQNAPRVLMAAILEDASQRNIGYFNFGGSAGQTGVEQFKGLFGAEEVEYACYRRKWLLG